MRKLCNFLLLISLALFIVSTYPIRVGSQGFPSTDALIPPDVDHEQLAEFSDPSPGYYETSEYLIGSVAIGIILLESDGSIDPSTENWDSDREEDVPIHIDDGLDVLVTHNPFSFTFDVHYRVPTGYEPINRPHTDHPLWVSEAMAYLGYTEGDHLTRVRDYINDLRDSTGTDWAFAIFVVDSENDPDGCFTDWYPEGNCYWYAFAYIGGPYFVMTYDVGGEYNPHDPPGVAQMDRVTAHETCHIFYATDEYNGVTEYNGYLNVADVEGSGKLMDWTMNWSPSDGTKGQIGWRPFGGLEDPINTFPDTYLVPYSPDPTTNPTPTYTGSVVDVPYPNNNPHGTGRDVTINTITNVQFRVDEGVWIDATPVDGTFDEALEDFSFTTPTLSPGTHKIETRGVNSVGHTEVSYASDIIEITLLQYTLTICVSPSTGGTTNPSPGTYQYVEGTPVTVTETPNPRYLFDHWDLDGVNVGSGTSYTVTMDGPHTLTAVFEMEQYFQLITEFMPYWKFSQGEQYYPVSFYFDNDIDVENNVHNYVKGSWESACVYVHIVEDENYYTIQYWLYYAYNPLGPGFPHQHDWDSTIYVILDAQSYTPLKVRFYRHWFPWTYNWEDVEHDGTHVIGYVAKNSHGVYKDILDMLFPPGAWPIDGWVLGGITLGQENITNWVIVREDNGHMQILVDGEYRWFCDVDYDVLKGEHPVPGTTFWPRYFGNYDAPWHRPDDWDSPDPQTSNDLAIFEVHSPVDLHVYDPEGLHVGVNETGQIEIEIPGALYTGPEADPEIIIIPNPLSGNYIIQIVGIETGTYNFTITRVINNIETYHEEHNNVEIQQNETQTITFTVSAPVGGIWISPNKLELLAPYIGLTSTIILAIAVIATFFKYRKK